MTSKRIVNSTFLPLNIMLRVSFSPNRDRACCHCWISPFGAPWENGRYTFKKDPLDNTCKKSQKQV